MLTFKNPNGKCLGHKGKSLTAELNCAMVRDEYVSKNIAEIEKAKDKIYNIHSVTMSSK